MVPLDTDQAANALRLLADAAAEREVEIHQFSSQPLTESEGESDSRSPVFDIFFESGGSAAIHQMTNFTAAEFHHVWNRIESFVADCWNLGRGKKSSVLGKDAFFMTLRVLKHGGTWEFLARMFDMKGPTFERLITKFVKLIWEKCYDELVLNLSDRYSMDVSLSQRRTFRFNPTARYATDVTFQQANRPSGNMQEGKKYYSGKQKLYGYKIEVYVTPFGMAVLCSNHYPGSIADIDIFYKMMGEHKLLLKKKDCEKKILDAGSLVGSYAEYWAVLMDKGYQGVADVMRAIIPTKKPRNGHLTSVKEKENQDISSDRIILENYFGRLCSLWTLFSSRFRWDEKMYDFIFKFGVAMTNEHILCNPLREGDLKFYQKYCNRNECIGREIAFKRKLKQQKYREKRRRHLAVQLKANVGSDDETQEF